MSKSPPNLNTTRGFTLIELMIVVAIVGVLASLAISSFQEYTTRAKIMEVVTLARRDIDLLREYFQLNGAVPDNPEVVGIYLGADKSEYLVADTVITWNGTAATATYSVDVGADAVGELRYTGLANASDLQFTCSSPDIPGRYLPKNCR
jgi:type IV pilus assembly protein PilA